MATDTPMQLGMIGLGRMGANLVRRLMRDGHRCVVYDVNADAVKGLEAEGATGSPTWPLRGQAGAAAGAVAHGARRHRPADAGQAPPAARRRRHRHRRRQLLLPGRHHPGQGAGRRIHYVDCGTSGGVWGLERGYCLMIGGEDEPVDAPRPDLQDDRPGRGRAPRPPRAGPTTHGTAAEGYLHCGPNGAGHFVKMVHNGIEYGMMAAIAEGLSIIEHADAGEQRTRSTRRPPRCATPGPTSTTSTWPRWPRCGGGARWSARGWST